MKRFAIWSTLLLCAGCQFSVPWKADGADDGTGANAAQPPEEHPEWGDPSGASTGAPKPERPFLGSHEIDISVHDTAFRPLVGAQVEVLDGPSAGLKAYVGVGGWISLNGTFDHTTHVRATMDGHLPAIQTADLIAGATHLRIGFALESVGPTVSLAGTFNLTFVADSACTDLPEELRTRTYSVTFTPSTSSSLDLVLAGASFASIAQWGSVAAVAGDYVAFRFGMDSFAGMVEELGPSTYAAINGSANASSVTSGATITTTFDGYLDYCALAAPLSGIYSGCGRDGETVAASAHCQSTKHTLILTPVGVNP